MPFTTLICFAIECDSCGEPNEHEDWGGRPHYETLEDARSQLVDDSATEYQWTVTDDLSTWTCPSCTATKACEAAGGHDWTAWEIGGGAGVRSCRRAACPGSEYRPVTNLEREL